MTILPDLWSIVCSFAYNATLQETKQSLDQILWLKGESINPLLLSDFVYDYSAVAQTYHFNRATRTARYYAKYKCERPKTTPIINFFVWYEIEDLFNTHILERVLWDLDYRSVKKHMLDCPVSIIRFARENLTRWIHEDPVCSVLYFNRIFPRLTTRMLRYYPSSISMLALYPDEPVFD